MANRCTREHIARCYPFPWRFWQQTGRWWCRLPLLQSLSSSSDHFPRHRNLGRFWPSNWIRLCRQRHYGAKWCQCFWERFPHHHLLAPCQRRCSFWECPFPWGTCKWRKKPCCWAQTFPLRTRLRGRSRHRRRSQDGSCHQQVCFAKTPCGLRHSWRWFCPHKGCRNGRLLMRRPFRIPWLPRDNLRHSNNPAPRVVPPNWRQWLEWRLRRRCFEYRRTPVQTVFVA